MKVKICGLKQRKNIEAIEAMKPDFLGFIMYPKSLRYAEPAELSETLEGLQTTAQTVGVFVNEEPEIVLDLCFEFGFDYAQLHGGESVEYCTEIREEGIKVIKVFRVGEDFDVSSVVEFVECADLFLFDTKTLSFGGSGRQFDWSVLEGYSASVPYLLSGGISENDVEKVKSMNLPGLVGVDANSQLEVEPGLKDLEKTKVLIQKVKA